MPEWALYRAKPPMLGIRLFAEGVTETDREALEAALESILKVMEHTDLDFSTYIDFKVNGYSAYIGSVAGFLKWSSEVKEGMEDG